MERNSKLEGPDADVEKQQQPLLLPPAAVIGEKPSPGGRIVGCEAFAQASLTATWTHLLVVLVAGTSFAAQLAAREEYALLAIFGSQLVSFCVFTWLLVLCALPEDGSQRRVLLAVGQVLQWSHAVALPTSMAFRVVQSAPVAVGATLVGVAVAVVFACYTELVRALWPERGPH